jgi:hypothetical protein
VRRQRGGDHGAVVDDGGGAGVGGTQHRQLELQRAQARDVQVLVHRNAVAEPADVADVGHHGGRQLAGPRSGAPVPHRTGLRSRCWAPRAAPDGTNEGGLSTPREVAQRDVHHLGEPAKAGGDELAKGHQVPLVVAVFGGHAGGAGRRQADTELV